MLKRIFLLSVMLLAAVGHPVKVSALTPEERFDSIVAEALYLENTHDRIVKLQEAKDLYVNNDIDDSYREAALDIQFGIYYYEIGDYKKTDSYCNKAEEVLQNYLETIPLNIVLKLLQCKNLEALSDTENAINKRCKLSEIIEYFYGKNDPFYIENADALLMDYLIVGDYAKVIDMYLYKIHPKLYKDGSTTKIKMDPIHKVLFYISRGEYRKAFDYYRKSLRDNPSMYIPNIADNVLCSLAMECCSPEYPELQRESIASNREAIVDNIIHFAELQYSLEAQNILVYISDFIPSLKEYPELTGDFFGLNLLRKGLSIHAINELKRMVAQTDAGREALAQIECINDSIREFSAGDGARIPQLQLRLELCQRKLHTLVPDMDELKSRLNKGASDAYKALPDRAVGIDFIRYIVPDTICRYGAFVYDGSGNSEFIDLFGETELLKRAELADNDIEFFFDKANTQLVWGKLIPIMRKYDGVYFCPDGILNNYPFEFFLTDEDSTVYDRYGLHRVFHLADIDEPVGLGDYLAAFGVSRYNNSKQDDSEQIVADPDRGSFADLPDVDKELENISNAIKGNGADIKVSCIKNACEEQVLSFSGSKVTAMHFAGHAFYIFSSDMEEASADPNNLNYNISRRMHYYRRLIDVPQGDFCGLLLRDGNTAWNSKSPLGRHDDLLTAEEVSDMYFPNLNLTVLSACESGFGLVDFDGSMGLQRAFRKAGTRNLLCSVASVNDNITSRFMTTFYTIAAQGMTVREAFVQARRKLQEEYPRRPDYWAPFILIE